MKKLFYYLSVMTVMLSFSGVALAKIDAVSSGLDQTASTATLNKSVTVQSIVGNIINAGLSLIGIIFLILAIYGGFKIMVSQGKEGYKTGKDTILFAFIGMLVVTAAYTLTKFVMERLNT